MKNTINSLRKKQLRIIWDGQSVASISREIGVNETTIHKWKNDLLSVNGEVDAEKLLMRKRIFE